MTIDLTNPDDTNWMADSRKRILRRIDLDDPAPENEWITPEYVAELRESYPNYADDDKDRDP